MKCEICHKSEAVAVLEKEVGGKRKELFVCKDCAAAERLSGKNNTPAAAHSESANGQTNSNMMLGLLLGEAFSILNKVTHDLQRPPINPSCPSCGITRNELRSRGSFGCPDCYKAFHREIKHWIAADQYAPMHVGKAPERHRLAAERLRLERRLRDAVFAQRFEEAAIIRDKLLALPRGEDDGEKNA